MAIFLIRRILQAITVLIVISLVGFLIKSNLGDPIAQLLPPTASVAERHALAQQLGLLDPWYIQYYHFVIAALHGQFGTSYFYHMPASDLILKRFPATFELVVATAILVILTSVPLGILTAVRSRAWYSKLILSLSIFGLAFPVFFIAILLIWLFSINLGWLPSFGRGEVVHLFGTWYTNFASIDGLRHILLPALSLTLIVAPLFIRLIRGEMLEALGSEYVRFAKAKGMPSRIVWIRHAFRNTLLPVITVGGLQLGNLVAFTILTETTFQWPGMGLMFLEAVTHADMSLIVTYIMFVGFFFVMLNTLVDILYIFLNPTISSKS